MLNNKIIQIKENQSSKYILLNKKLLIKINRNYIINQFISTKLYNYTQIIKYLRQLGLII